MDPTLAVVLSALTAGAVAGTTDVAKEGVGDAYTKLKQLLSRRTVDGGDEVAAVLREYEEVRHVADLRLAERLEAAGVHYDAAVVDQAREALGSLSTIFGQIEISESTSVVVGPEANVRVRVGKIRY